MDRADSRRESLIAQLYSDTPQASYSSSDVAIIFMVAPRVVLQWVRVGRLQTWRTPGGRHRFNPHYLRQVAEDCGVHSGCLDVAPTTPKRRVASLISPTGHQQGQDNEVDKGASIRVEYLTVEGAAVYLGMSRSSIQRVIDSGDLPVDRQTIPFRIRIADIDELVERSLIVPGPVVIPTQPDH